MNQQEQNPHNARSPLPLLVIAIFSVLAFFLLISAGLLFALGLPALQLQGSGAGLSLHILAGGLFGLALLLLPGIYYNLRKFTNSARPALNFPALNDFFLLPSLVGLWALCLLAGELSLKNDLLSMFLLPGLNFLGIILPILFYLRISLRHLELPGVRFGWSFFGANLFVPPGLSMLLEALAVGIIVLIYLVFISVTPGLETTLLAYVTAFQASSQEQADVLNLAINIVNSPGVGLTLLGTFSVVIPIIEESLKLILLLPFLKRMRSANDGFVLGILCGAAFALSENIGFTSAGGEDWVLNIATRATAALPHMFNSGLLGWGLVSAWKYKKVGRLVGAFSAVLAIHGGWNALGLGLALDSLSPLENISTGFLPVNFLWITAWVLLALALSAGLVIFNHRLAKSV